MSSLYMPIKEITPLPFDVYLAELVVARQKTPARRPRPGDGGFSLYYWN
jgi:hypothetical protein